MNLDTLINALTLAAVLWLFKGNYESNLNIATIKTALFGVDGDNGMRGDIKELKQAHEILDNKLIDLKITVEGLK